MASPPCLRKFNEFRLFMPVCFKNPECLARLHILNTQYAHITASHFIEFCASVNLLFCWFSVHYASRSNALSQGLGKGALATNRFRHQIHHKCMDAVNDRKERLNSIVWRFKPGYKQGRISLCYTMFMLLCNLEFKHLIILAICKHY